MLVFNFLNYSVTCRIFFQQIPWKQGVSLSTSNEYTEVCIVANYTKQMIGTKMSVQSIRGMPLEKKYRNHLEIFASMLETVKGGGARRFSIMRQTSVNSAQLKKHLGSLTEMGLVEIDENGGQALYKATDRDLEFLRHYNILQRTMWDGGLARTHMLHSFVT